MTKMQSGGRFLLAFVVSTAVAGCSTELSGTAVEASKSADGSTASDAATANTCEQVRTTMKEIGSLAGDEPKLVIPQPLGWERYEKLDSQLIRYTMVNTGLAANKFAPTAVVTLESVDSTDVEPQELLDQERSTLVSSAGASNLDVTPGSLCGYTAETVTYEVPSTGDIAPRSAVVLIAAAPFGDKTYAVTVTVQSTEPDNPTYTSDAATILKGFQMVAPAA